MRWIIVFGLTLLLSGCTTGPTRPADPTETGDEYSGPFAEGWLSDEHYTSNPVEHPSNWSTFKVHARPEGFVSGYTMSFPPGALPLAHYLVIPFIPHHMEDKLITWGIVIFDLSTGEADVADLQLSTPRKRVVSTSLASTDDEYEIRVPDRNVTIPGKLRLNPEAETGDRLGILVFGNSTEPISFDAAIKSETASAGWDKFMAARAAGDLRHLEHTGDSENGGFNVTYLYWGRAFGRGLDCETSISSLQWMGNVTFEEQITDGIGGAAACGIQQHYTLHSEGLGWSLLYIPGALEGEFEGRFDTHGTQRSLEMTMRSDPDGGLAITQDFDMDDVYKPFAVISEKGTGPLSLEITSTHPFSIPNGQGSKFHFTTGAPLEEWFDVPVKECWTLMRLNAEGPLCEAPYDSGNRFIP